MYLVVSFLFGCNIQVIVLYFLLETLLQKRYRIGLCECCGGKFQLEHFMT